MTPFTFVHAADLHLDAPFRGITSALASDDHGTRHVLRSLFADAGFSALDRLVSVCLSARADFLLLAGDVYNSALSSLRARLALRDAFLKLESAGVSVFLAHGNHDPLVEGEVSIPWPANVFVFGPQLETRTAYRKGSPLARIHGISHTSEKEERNLALLFVRGSSDGDATHGNDDAGLFQIGLLHCALDGQFGIHANYAPCTVADLAGAGLDYWALGHVHSPQIMGQRGAVPRHPYIVYPGSTQGMHVNESGPHGCMVVKVDAHGVAAPHMVPIAPVQWETLTVELDASTGPESIPDLESLVLEHLETLSLDITAFTREALFAVGFAENVWPAPAVVVRLTLRGRTSLDHELRRPGALEALQHHMEQELRGIWLRDIVAATRPLIDLAAVAQRPDLTGEVARVSAALRNDAEALDRLRDEALAPLFQRPKLRGLLSVPDGVELAALAEEASMLCLDLLEGE